MALTTIAAGLSAPAIARPAPPPLRMCAESSNMPFSDRRGEGFENQIAALVARRLGRTLQYVWLPPDVDMAALPLGRNACDVVIAEPRPTPGMDTTVPYYWSSYVLVTRADRRVDLESLKDPRLKHMRIGVESIGRQGLLTPPARVLIGEGLADRLVPFTHDSRAALVQALVRGRIDVAAVWGPAVGYLARRAPVPLRVAIIKDGDSFSTRKDHFGLQAMQFQISMGVRRDEGALRRALDAVIDESQPQIRRTLERFGVPLIDPASFSAAAPVHAAAGAAGVPAHPPGA